MAGGDVLPAIIFMRYEKNALHIVWAFLKEGINQGAKPRQQGVYHAENFKDSILAGHNMDSRSCDYVSYRKG